MWTKFRTSKTAKDDNKFPIIHKILNVNEEYVRTIRTQSYVDFLTKAQLVFTETTSSPAMEVFLEPEQDLIPTTLEELLFPKPALSNFKLLLLNFFDTSAEASRVCIHLLRSINETHTNYKLIQRALDRFVHYTPQQYDSAIQELDSFTLLSNPFANPKSECFELINVRYNAISDGLNVNRRKVSRRIKLIDFVKKASGVCLKLMCGVVALIAIGIAVHSISGLVLGPLLLGLLPFRVKEKLSKLGCFKSGTLRKLRERLDIAARGAYTLNRDFDTMSRLVVRLRDEVDHMKGMIRYCLDRKEDMFPLQEVVKDLRKRGRSFKQQVEELEEHVCLCLVTINRARVLVMKEMSKP